MPLSANSPLHAGIDDIVNAAESPYPLERMKTVLRDLTNRFHSLGVLVHESFDNDRYLAGARPIQQSVSEQEKW